MRHAEVVESSHADKPLVRMQPRLELRPRVRNVEIMV
jgi:hypothetical protein